MRNLFFLCALFAASAGNSALVDYCGEINLAPDLTQNNPRYYDNQHTRDCSSSTLPGFAAIPGLSDAVCEEIESASRSALDVIRDDVSQRIQTHSNDLQNQLSNISESSSVGESNTTGGAGGANSSSSGGSTPTEYTNMAGQLSPAARAALKALVDKEKKNEQHRINQAQSKKKSQPDPIPAPQPSNNDPYSGYYN